VNLPYLTQVKGELVHFDYMLTRAKFNELTRDLVDRTAIPVQNALNDAGIAPSELGKVLLVGGSTRIPAVQEKVRLLTGITPSKNINPDECVAQGAAVQGDTLSGGSLQLAGSGNGILLLDVTPLSLSIETVGGVATRLVERNSTLPIHHSQVFSTAAPYQRNVEIHVLQGERPMARDNKTIGKFRLNGIKRAPAGVPQIEVTFDIDTNGILKVSAKDLDTGKEQSITITANEKMSDYDIEQAIRDAEQYAAQDQIRREALEVTNNANMLLAKTEQAVNKVAKQIGKEEKRQVKNDCLELRKLLTKTKPEKMTQADISAIRGSMGILEQSGANVRRMAEME
ncbi:MAG: Hsp70 family protein, partial [Clostridia bacterium]|nr:Hsp70 family protein [Clostridia bacterium]